MMPTAASAPWQLPGKLLDAVCVRGVCVWGGGGEVGGWVGGGVEGVRGGGRKGVEV